MGNVIKTVRSTGSDYWAAHVGGEKIKTDGLKQDTRTDVIKYPLMTYLSPDYELKNKLQNFRNSHFRNSRFCKKVHMEKPMKYVAFSQTKYKINARNSC